MDTNELLLQLITALTPVIGYALTVYVRLLVPKLPGWSIPILAMGLGVVVNVITAQAGGPNISPILAAVYGSLAIFVNRIIEALRATRPPNP